LQQQHYILHNKTKTKVLLRGGQWHILCHLPVTPVVDVMLFRLTYTITCGIHRCMNCVPAIICTKGATGCVFKLWSL